MLDNLRDLGAMLILAVGVLLVLEFWGWLTVLLGLVYAEERLATSAKCEICGSPGEVRNRGKVECKVCRLFHEYFGEEETA